MPKLYVGSYSQRPPQLEHSDIVFGDLWTDVIVITNQMTKYFEQNNHDMSYNKPTTDIMSIFRGLMIFHFAQSIGC